jgi:mono/diheme cytochrome c family protein
MTRHSLFLAALFSGVLLAFPALEAAEQSQPLPDGPGKDLLMSRCFQCHSEGMWKDHRQDRRGWEGTLYRMVGRGALWTEDEINAMASYLATLPAQEAKASKSDSK